MNPANRPTTKNASLIGGILAVLVGALIIFWAINAFGGDDSSVPTKQTKEDCLAGGQTEEYCSNSDNLDLTKNDEADSNSENQTDEAQTSNEFTYSQSAQLPDVTNGATILGITTDGNASGTAKAGFNDGKYMMAADFQGLPDPVDDAFYEGWLVNPDTTEFFSTGPAERNADGVYEDTYESDIDYTQTHIRYVLTLEPNDGDPAPADHIVEANMVAN